MKNLIAALLIFSSAALFYVFIDPAYEEIKVLRAKKAEYDDAINNSQKIQVFRDELLNKYNSFSPSDLQRLEKLLPNHIENIRLIIEADSIASRHNMTLKNVQISAPEEEQPLDIQLDENGQPIGGPPSPYGTAEFLFEVTGSYPAYRNFLKNIEKSLRIIDITGMSLSVKTDGKKDEEIQVSDIYTFKTSGQTYWLK